LQPIERIHQKVKDSGNQEKIKKTMRIYVRSMTKNHQTSSSQDLAPYVEEAEILEEKKVNFELPEQPVKSTNLRNVKNNHGKLETVSDRWSASSKGMNTADGNEEKPRRGGP